MNLFSKLILNIFKCTKYFIQNLVFSFVIERNLSISGKLSAGLMIEPLSSAGVSEILVKNQFLVLKNRESNLRLGIINKFLIIYNKN